MAVNIQIPRGNTVTRSAVGAVLALFLFCGVGRAQDAALRGVVSDQSGAVVPGASVTATLSANGLHYTQITDSAGRYVFPFLSPGVYALAVEIAGFQTVRRPAVILDVGAVEQLNVTIRLAPLNEAVEVKAGSPPLDETPGVGLVIDRQFLENMPLNGRTLQSLFLMVPGVVEGSGDGQLSVNGMRTTSNNFMIDGVSANVGVSRGPRGQQSFSPLNSSRGMPGDTDTNASGANPAFNAFGGSNDMVQLEAVEQFRVQTSAYSAQYGRQPGGQVQLVTRSGTNRYSGTAFEYFRDSALDAHDWFANATPNADREPLDQHQFGGVFGGPLVRDHAFFFASYEGTAVRAPLPVQQRRVPALRLRDNPALAPELARLLNAYPLPQGPEFVDNQGRPLGVGPFYDSGSTLARSNPYSVKIDANLGPALLLSGRWNQGVSRRTSFILAERTSSATDLRTLTVNARSVISTRLLHELSGNRSRNGADNGTELTDRFGVIPIDVRDLLPAFAPASASTQVSLPGAATSYNLGPSVANGQEQMNLVDSLSWNRGPHNVRFGVDFRRLTPRYGPTEYHSTATFNTVDALLRNQASALTIATSDQIQLEQINFSAYAQDTFRIKPRLTLDYGLRWELNPAPRGLGKPLYTLEGFPDLTALALAPAGTPLYPTRWAKLAPRAGAAFRLRQSADRSAVLRASFGLYYDTGTGATATAARMFPYNRTVRRTNVPYPSTDANAQPAPPLDLNPPYTGQDFTVIGPDNTLPRTYQWSVSLEQAFGASQRLTATYTGHRGEQLLRRYFYAFDGTHPVNPSFPLARLNITRNDPGWGDSSRYHALQLQYIRRLSKGLQVLANYTLAKATDTGSDDTTSNIVNNSPSPTRYDGYSRNDRRHSVNAAATYQLPAPPRGRALLGGWWTDVNLRMQSAAPLTVRYTYQDPADTLNYPYRVDLVPGQPFWIADASAPGGKRLNLAAFAVPGSAFGAGSRNQVDHGNETRNGVRGFGMWQADFVLRREVVLPHGRSAQFRVDVFNVFNNPSFSEPDVSIGTVVGATGRFIPATQFGLATQSFARGTSASGGLSSAYATGAARAVQLAVRVSF